MNGEIIPVIGLLAGGAIGTATDYIAIKKQSAELENLAALPAWKKMNQSSTEEVSSEDKKSIKTARALGKNIFSILAATGAIVGLSAGSIISNLAGNNSKNITNKVGIVIDRSGSVLLDQRGNQSILNIENGIISSLEQDSSHLNMDITSQNNSFVESYRGAISSIPIGIANIGNAISDVQSNSKAIYAITNGNGIDNSSQVSQVISSAKKNHQTINFYNLSSNNLSSVGQMKEIASKTGGKYYSDTYSPANFSDDIKRILSKSAVDSGSNPNQSGELINYSLIGLIGLSAMYRVYKSRSRYIIGNSIN